MCENVKRIVNRYCFASFSLPSPSRLLKFLNLAHVTTCPTINRCPALRLMRAEVSFYFSDNINAKLIPLAETNEAGELEDRSSNKFNILFLHIVAFSRHNRQS